MIKLLQIGKTDNTIRLQSQLLVGKDITDFILEDGILKNWCHRDGVLGFHKTDIKYEIVETKNDMMYQPL
jgi:hypothetical protein